MGGHDQAVAYLDQALSIATEPADRASLLDRAARSAAVASRDALRYAEAAIEAYHELGDGIAEAGATARLGRVLIDAGDVVLATTVLEAALPAAEAIGDEPVLAEILANLSRAYMRRGVTDKAIEAADRALPIAERLNLDAIVAEAFVNKGSALNIAGRRRESIAIQQAAVEMAVAGPDRNFELRARNNFASALMEDEPARATVLLLEASELARQVGDRAMYSWTLSTGGTGLFSEGRGWDAHMAQMREALEDATLPHDRLRLRILLSLIETARGEHLGELVADITRLVGDSTEPDDLFGLYMARGNVALVTGNPEDAYRNALLAVEMMSQNPEVPLGLAVRAAIWARDLDRARHAAQLRADVPAGALGRAEIAHVEGAVAALEGRTAEAIAKLQDARERLERLEQMFEAACYVVDAAVLLPGETEVRAWAAEVRPLLEELRARPYLDRLDMALASAPEAPSNVARTEARIAETPGA